MRNERWRGKCKGVANTLTVCTVNILLLIPHSALRIPHSLIIPVNQVSRTGRFPTLSGCDRRPH